MSLISFMRDGLLMSYTTAAVAHSWERLMLPRNMGRDVHILQLVLLFCALLTKTVNLINWKQACVNVCVMQGNVEPAIQAVQKTFFEETKEVLDAKMSSGITSVTVLRPISIEGNLNVCFNGSFPLNSHRSSCSLLHNSLGLMQIFNDNRTRRCWFVQY